MSAFFTVLLFVQLGFTSRTGQLVPLVVALAFIIVADLFLHIIPDVITLPAMVYGLFLASIAGLPAFGTAVAGGTVAGGLILALAVISRGGIGGGDFKLMALIGVVVGLKPAVVVFVLSQFLGLAVAGVLWVRDGRFFNRALPIGAIIAALAVVVIVSRAT